RDTSINLAITGQTMLEKNLLQLNRLIEGKRQALTLCWRIILGSLSKLFFVATPLNGTDQPVLRLQA
ncbi:MAG: hypothetical protein LBC41_17470, partial [Clostridiales bacterium]|nr:hypothetical protein [Clostridiales bacterium]